MEVPWPDRLHQILESSYREGDDRYEVYPFAYDGGGLSNWHRAFFKEIAPNFEFDAVIIAIYGSDLTRRFIILDSSDKGVMYWRFPEPPRSEYEYRRDYAPQLRELYSVVADSEIDRRIESARGAGKFAWEWPGADAYAAKFLWERSARLADKLKGRDKPGQFDGGSPPEGDRSPFSAAELEKRLPNGELNKLSEIIGYCRERGIPVLLASLPDREAAMACAGSGGKRIHPLQREVWSLAGHFATYYFDGYEIFAHLEPDEIRNAYWLKYDGHWAQRGGDLFASRLAEFIRTQWRGIFQ